MNPGGWTLNLVSCWVDQALSYGAFLNHSYNLRWSLRAFKISENVSQGVVGEISNFYTHDGGRLVRRSDSRARHLSLGATSDHLDDDLDARV